MPVGHFTTMQVRGGAVQGLDLHLRRLCDANRELFASGLDGEALRSGLRTRLEEDGAACTVRILVRDPDVPEFENGPPRFVPATPLRLRSHRGVRSRPALKHLDLGHQLGARRVAVDAGFDDALLVDAGGLIAEGTFWNVAFWDGAGIAWPEAPMLDGITQRLLQAALRDAGLPQRHAPVRLDRLAGMRAAFALNSRGLQHITSVDDCRFEGDAAVSSRLRELLASQAWQRP